MAAIREPRLPPTEHDRAVRKLAAEKLSALLGEQISVPVGLPAKTLEVAPATYAARERFRQMRENLAETDREARALFSDVQKAVAKLQSFVTAEQKNASARFAVPIVERLTGEPSFDDGQIMRVISAAHPTITELSARSHLFAESVVDLSQLPDDGNDTAITNAIFEFKFKYGAWSTERPRLPSWPNAVAEVALFSLLNSRARISASRRRGGLAHTMTVRETIQWQKKLVASVFRQYATEERRARTKK